MENNIGKRLIQFRAPECVSDALDRAAHKNLQSKSEYVRRSVIDRLRADGIDPVPFVGAV